VECDGAADAVPEGLKAGAGEVREDVARVVVTREVVELDSDVDPAADEFHTLRDGQVRREERRLIGAIALADD